MATKFLRSTVEGREPAKGTANGQLDSGEIALNINPANPFLCFLDGNGVVRRLGVWVGGAAPATPAKGELWLDTTTANRPALRCYDGTNWSTGGATDGFAAGTRILFQQSAAPAGWVKDTTHNNKALRIVNGTAGTGGQVEFTTAFSAQAISGTIGATALTVAHLPAHSHGVTDPGHSHGINDPGHGHTYQDPGHAHRYNNVQSYSADSPTKGENQQAHVRSVWTAWDWNEHRYTGITINNNGTGVSVQNAGSGVQVQNTGSGQAHTHSLTGAGVNLEVAYVDVIIAQKL